MGKLRMLRAVAVKEVRELLRDPITLGIALLLPLAMLLIFGYGVNVEVHEVATALVDLDGTPESRDYGAEIDRTAEFDVVARSGDERTAGEALDRGDAKLAVIIPEGFSRELREGRAARVQTLVDGSFSASAQIFTGYLEALGASFARRQLRSGIASPATGRPDLRIEPRVWYNPSLGSAHSIVPGLFGVILMAFPPLLTALAVVKEKEQGSIRQIFVSSMPPWVFVLGKLVPYAVVAVVDMLLVLGAGLAWFRIPLRGSGLLLAFAAVLYVLATLGIGLLVSTLARTQVVALLLVLVITVMPSFMFSGFLFPIFAMPTPLQYYTYLFPGRYFVALARGIFLKGVGFDVLYPNLLLLGGYAGVLVAVASLRLRTRLD